MKLSSSLILLSIGIIFLLGVQPIEAVWGDRDGTFGHRGLAVDHGTEDHIPHDIVLQQDGRILVTGYKVASPLGGTRMFLRRYLENGSPDLSFGINGWATGSWTHLRFADYKGERIRVMPNGKIAVLGLSNGKHGVWMIGENGFGNQSFGTSGRVELSIYSDFKRIDVDVVFSARLLILVAKEGQFGRLIRLSEDGSLDQLWGTDGSRTTHLVGASQRMLVDINGNIVLAGQACKGSGPECVPFSGFYDATLKLRRVLPNGTSDASFTPYVLYGYQNPNLIPFSSFTGVNLVELSGGAILVKTIGTLPSLGAHSPNVVFTVDPTGLPIVDFDTFESYIASFAGIQADGKLVAGPYAPGTNVNGRLRRRAVGVNADMELTPATLFSGWDFNFPSGDVFANAGHPKVAALLSDDRLVVVGRRNGVIALTRLNAN